MINVEKLYQVLEGYKTYFPEHWNVEKYKWEAVQHFQNNWDIDSEDFGEMFKKATAKTYNLLASGHSYPRNMIGEFSTLEPETVRNMFRDLYDETKALEERVDSFRKKAKKLFDKYGKWKSHDQSTNAISTYLWLKFPDQYYIYKYGIAAEIAKELQSDCHPEGDGTIKSMMEGYRLYDEINTVLRQKTDIIKMIEDAITDKCYKDEFFKTATIDVAYYFGKYYMEQKKIDGEGGSKVNYWWLTADPKEWKYSDMEVDEEQFYTLYNEKGNRRRIFSHFLEAKRDDIIFCYESSPIKKIVGLAAVTKEQDGEKIYFKKKEGFSTPILFDEIREADELAEFEFNVQNRGSIFKVEKKEYEFLMKKIKEKNPDVPAPQNYTEHDFLTQVYMSKHKYEMLSALLKNKKNVILQGAPGVGKTFTAKRLAYAMMGEKDDSRIEFIQFHQNYSYEDFIMGYRPEGNGFALKKGVFMEFCEKAAKDKENKYFFIIDEINRGNMSKIFGELLMMIEKDYRDVPVKLAYSGEKFSVPGNIYILGMMNTADRSLAMIDYALRRRFSFFNMEPGFDSEGFKKYQRQLNDGSFDDLIESIQELNETIREDRSLGKGFQIGHSYFCGKKENECTNEWMQSLVEYDILPMLSEYWFDDPEKYSKWEIKLRGVVYDER